MKIVISVLIFLSSFSTYNIAATSASSPNSINDVSENRIVFLLEQYSELTEQDARLTHSYEELRQHFWNIRGLPSSEGSIPFLTAEELSSARSECRNHDCTIALDLQFKLESSQRNWLTYIRNRCRTSECVETAYSDRQFTLNIIWQQLDWFTISLLRAGKITKESSYVEDYTQSFQQIALDRSGQTVLYCDEIISVPIGTSRGNVAYGGFCNAQKADTSTMVMICNDQMIGHFAIQNIVRRDASLLDLAEFVYQNCLGG